MYWKGFKIMSDSENVSKGKNKNSRRSAKNLNEVTDDYPSVSKRNKEADVQAGADIGENLYGEQ
jgi:hypothetical protein